MKISIIGAGAMGGALAEGLMQSDAVSASDLTISDPSEAALTRFSDSGASITTDNNAAANFFFTKNLLLNITNVYNHIIKS